MTTTDRPASDVQGATREQWDELFAAAHRLNVFCRTIDALRWNENSDASEEINYMERAAWSESHHIAELIAVIPSPYDDTTREEYGCIAAYDAQRTEDDGEASSDELTG